MTTTKKSAQPGAAVTSAAKGPSIAAAYHPTGKAPRSVAVVACGPTSQQWHAGNFSYERVHGKPDEVWIVNKGIRTLRADLAFVMDDMVGEARRAPSYADDIRELHIPIITSTVDQYVREIFARNDLHEYPLGPVWSWLGVQILRRRGVSNPPPSDILAEGMRAGNYFNNSLPYILAYAAFIGVEHLGLFGADYTFPGQEAREDDRANAEYWVGLVRGLGMVVTVPHNTTLLNTSHGTKLYGYGARAPYVELPTAEQIAMYA